MNFTFNLIKNAFFVLFFELEFNDYMIMVVIIKVSMCCMLTNFYHQLK